MREVVRESGAGAIAMHMQGTPADMQRAPHYDNVVAEIRDFFRQTLTACVACGMDPLRLAFDPGIGFGKTMEHNLSSDPKSRGAAGGGIVRWCWEHRGSRSSAKSSASADPADRAWPTVALTSFGRERGANVFRVHDVAAKCRGPPHERSHPLPGGRRMSFGEFTTFAQAHWKDAIEIILLAVSIYYVWLFFKGTPGANVLVGLVGAVSGRDALFADPRLDGHRLDLREPLKECSSLRS